MAWPLSRLTTYIANSVPAIKAFDLNEIQDKLADLYAGLRSIKGLVVDGVGGVAATAVAGAVQVSASVVGLAMPTAVTQLGLLAKEHIPAAIGHFALNAPPTLLAGINIKDTSRAGAGDYTVTFSFKPPGLDATRAVVIAIPRSTINGVDRVRVHDTLLEAGTDLLQARLVFPADCSFFVVAWAV